MTEELEGLPEWTDEERRLLASAELDRPPGDALPRAARAAAAAAVATGIAAAPASALGVGAKAGALFGLGKWLAVVTLVGGAAVGVTAWRHGRASRSNEAPRSAGTVPARSAGPQAAVEAMSSSTAEPAEPTPVPVVAPLPTSSASAPHRAAGRAVVARPESSAPAQPDLTRDIATLDEARRALRAGRAGDALAALDRYDREFGKSGALRVEARVLRIEATARAGDPERARKMASAFLKQSPQSPYAPRLRALLAP